MSDYGRAKRKKKHFVSVITCKGVQDQTVIEVCEVTMGNILNVACELLLKPHLTINQSEKMYGICKVCDVQKYYFWGNVVFFEETKFN